MAWCLKAFPLGLTPTKHFPPRLVAVYIYTENDSSSRRDRECQQAGIKGKWKTVANECINITSPDSKLAATRLAL